MPILAEQMKKAELLARAGERDRARELFQMIVAEEPDSATAWLWISDLSTNLEEQTSALDKALALCPEDIAGNRDLQSRLNTIRGSIPLSAPAVLVVPEPPADHLDEVELTDLLRQADRYIILGKSEDAQKLLNRILAIDPHNEAARLLLGEAQTGLIQKSALPQEAAASKPTAKRFTFTHLLVVLGLVLLLALMIFLFNGQIG